VAYVARILQMQDLEEILEFEKSKLKDLPGDPIENEISSWNSAWRKEALEHHLPLGWSFCFRDENQSSSFSKEGLLVGYFIAQPLLFFDNQTQSLWVEHISYLSLQARDEICELAYRLAREKHFQRVFFSNSPAIRNAVQSFKPEAWGSETIFLRTTKS
jgi:hypothetical protein